MRVEHLKQWVTKARKAAKDRETAVGKEEEEAAMTEIARPVMSEAQKGTESESDNWTRVMDLVQSEFWEGKLAEKAMWPRGGDVEGSGGDLKLPAHGLHHLPQLPLCFPGRLQDSYRHPRGQAVPAVCVLEVGGPVRDLPGPAQGV